MNELELIDFLSELRQQAAVVALDKLSGLDQNGDEAVSFSEFIQGYDKQLEKFELKKIFTKVDVNKNAHIDPIEFVSLQNLVADEIRSRILHERLLKQQYPGAPTHATTPSPTLIIFTAKNKRPNSALLKRIRRSS
ncbi:unnamed protein product [Gongylonema pulchrum]|uniref:EF-hand domain-containing protein n=1 Tax=Gongylonema pulchrum TaxID=637853 RepID=A0A183DJH7_9BILA|nr:unnamed protein product [Gongylonema pulchrum]